MNESLLPTPEPQAYETPAIVYESELEVRAGSVIPSVLDPLNLEE